MIHLNINVVTRDSRATIILGANSIGAPEIKLNGVSLATFSADRVGEGGGQRI